jgi:4'-phosphopantetheinyl transferase EntD
MSGSERVSARSPDVADRGVCDDIWIIENALKQWFPMAFVRAAQIQSYPMLHEEEALVSRAVASRRNEFSTGRWLARQGLQGLGLADSPIGMGRLRNPLWPSNVIGTISHDGGLCAVALLKKPDNPELGIGLDLVAKAPRTDQMTRLLPMFLTDARELVALSAIETSADRALLLFSIKESVIKSLSYQLTDFIDMREVEVYFTNKLQFKLFGREIDGDIFIATSKNYLLTAANALN